MTVFLQLAAPLVLAAFVLAWIVALTVPGAASPRLRVTLGGLLTIAGVLLYHATQ